MYIYVFCSMTKGPTNEVNDFVSKTLDGEEKKISENLKSLIGQNYFIIMLAK